MAEGTEWHRAGQPVQVRAHEFPEKDAQKAVPYGIYDLHADAGWVSVGCDGDTAAFAVATLRRWWHGEGRHHYPGATRPLITADAGGPNGYRVRAWRKVLADFAHATDLEVTVCHFLPGTSQWSPTGKSCDESPCASTEEGGATGVFSRRMINEKQNSTAGGSTYLLKAYKDNRILNGDAFWIAIS